MSYVFLVFACLWDLLAPEQFGSFLIFASEFLRFRSLHSLTLFLHFLMTSWVFLRFLVLAMFSMLFFQCLQPFRVNHFFMLFIFSYCHHNFLEYSFVSLCFVTSSCVFLLYVGSCVSSAVFFPGASKQVHAFFARSYLCSLLILSIWSCFFQVFWGFHPFYVSLHLISFVTVASLFVLHAFLCSFLLFFLFFSWICVFVPLFEIKCVSIWCLMRFFYLHVGLPSVFLRLIFDPSLLTIAGSLLRFVPFLTPVFFFCFTFLVFLFLFSSCQSSRFCCFFLCTSVGGRNPASPGMY